MKITYFTLHKLLLTAIFILAISIAASLVWKGILFAASDSPDLVTEMSGFSCGPDGDCTTTDDNRTDNVYPTEKIRYSVGYDNIGTDSAENPIVTGSIPEGTCYILDSIEENQPSGTTLSYSDDNRGTWTYTPVEGESGYDCNVTDYRLEYSYNLESSYKQHLEDQSSEFKGTFTDLEVYDLADEDVLQPTPITEYSSTSGFVDSSNWIYDLASADINNDGIDDIITAEGGCTTSGCSMNDSILYSDGDETFTRNIYNTSGYNYDVNLGDFDKDGNQDLILAEHQTANERVLFNNGDGTFSLVSLTKSGIWSKEARVADFDQDGFEDIAIGSSASLYVYFSNGNRTFTELSLTTFTYGVGIGDFDDDGYPDIAARKEGSAEIFFSDGIGRTFTKTTIIDDFGPIIGTAHYDSRIGVGDINDDG
ncbi:MAG: VCBS repeat-containing protein [Candidatus Dojkabacteria bacterium]|nr:VCBS repeat-containing protein [Candidatus Dojkabacteria bacterium]